MSDIEWALVWIVVVFFLFKIADWFFDNPTSISTNYDNNSQQYIENNTKIYKKIEKLNLWLEWLIIKREEIENEIQNLELEWNMDFEKEAVNSTKIKKLNLQLKHLGIKIEKLNQEIYDLNMQLNDINRWNYLLFLN